MDGRAQAGRASHEPISLFRLAVHVSADNIPSNSTLAQRRGHWLIIISMQNSGGRRSRPPSTTIREGTVTLRSDRLNLHGVNRSPDGDSNILAMTSVTTTIRDNNDGGTSCRSQRVARVVVGISRRFDHLIVCIQLSHRTRRCRHGRARRISGGEIQARRGEQGRGRRDGGRCPATSSAIVRGKVPIDNASAVGVVMRAHDGSVAPLHDDRDVLQERPLPDGA